MSAFKKLNKDRAKMGNKQYKISINIELKLQRKKRVERRKSKGKREVKKDRVKKVQQNV